MFTPLPGPPPASLRVPLKSLLPVIAQDLLHTGCIIQQCSQQRLPTTPTTPEATFNCNSHKARDWVGMFLTGGNNHREHSLSIISKFYEKQTNGVRVSLRDLKWVIDQSCLLDCQNVIALMTVCWGYRIRGYVCECERKSRVIKNANKP